MGETGARNFAQGETSMRSQNPTRAKVLLFVSVLALFAVVQTSAPAISLAAGRDDTPANEVTVWVNLNSKVYHCPGSRWYGETKNGKYMGECEARKNGFRPAYSDPCGSTCW